MVTDVGLMSLAHGNVECLRQLALSHLVHVLIQRNRVVKSCLELLGSLCLLLEIGLDGGLRCGIWTPFVCTPDFRGSLG